MKILFICFLSFLYLGSNIFTNILFADGYNYLRREKAIEERTDHFVEKQIKSSNFKKKQKSFQKRVIDLHTKKYIATPQPQSTQQSKDIQTSGQKKVIKKTSKTKVNTKANTKTKPKANTKK